VRENRAPRQAGVGSKEALLFVCNSDKRHLLSKSQWAMLLDYLKFSCFEE
jgi:hypothetical protein